MSLEENIRNRAWLVARVRAEVVGPDPSGEPVVPSNPDKLPDCTWKEFRTPRKQQQDGEEALWQDSPLKRYGAGILYPAGSHLRETDTSSTEAPEEPAPVASPQNDKAVAGSDEAILSRGIADADDSEDYAVSLANAMSPSAIGLSFLADLSAETDGIALELANVTRTSSESLVEGSSATYRRSKVTVRDDKGRGKRKGSLASDTIADQRWHIS